MTSNVILVIKVQGIPPYKQAPADESERKNQEPRKSALKTEAEDAVRRLGVKFDEEARLKLWILYDQKDGRADAANLIGGIADANSP